jgi:hypothetical protein
MQQTWELWSLRTSQSVLKKEICIVSKLDAKKTKLLILLDINLNFAVQCRLQNICFSRQENSVSVSSTAGVVSSTRQSTQLPRLRVRPSSSSTLHVSQKRTP